MTQSLRLLKYDLNNKYGRLRYYSFMLRNLPGKFGERLRVKFLTRYFADCGKNTVIHPGVRFRGIHRLFVGDCVNIGVDVFIQASGKVVLDNNVMLGPGVKIWSVNHKFDVIDQPIIEQGYEEKEVVIGKGCWLGANTIVLPGVHLPEGCIVSAGSVVGIKKYPPFSILAGNPARVVGNRRKESK